MRRGQRNDCRGGFQTRPYPASGKRPRRRRLRLPDHDYASPGAYFVTICTHRRVCLFGQIINDTMRPNPFGEIVETCWQDLAVHYPNVRLDAFIIMPNHIHGILILEEPIRSAHGLTEIIRAFKTFSARRINEKRGTSGLPLWQRGYYEHIARNDAALDGIRAYIEANPARWPYDKNNPQYTPPVGAGLKPAPTNVVSRVE